MAKKTSRTISSSLTNAGVIITNSQQDPDIQARVGKYGYDAARLSQGKGLYDTATALVNKKVSDHGVQTNSTADLATIEQTARVAYESFAKIFRGEFKGKKALLSELGLDGAAPRSTAAFIELGKTLFSNAMSTTDDTIKAALTEYGYDTTTLTAENQKILDFESANAAQQAAKGDAEEATAQEQDALKALNDWVAQYKKVASVALKDKPKLLNKLGMKVRTTKTKAQRAAPKKAAATRAAKRQSK